MRKKITILAMLLATLVLEVPADGFGESKNKPATIVPTTNETRVSVSAEQPRRRRMRRGWRNGRRVWVSYYSYPRYRLVRRYYWDDGRRRSRYVRIYF